MVERSEVMAYLDQVLEPGVYPDACPNGLQVYGREQIQRLATCPSVSLAFFEQALQAGADALLVHHGLFWERDSRVIEPHLGARLRLLLEARVNLIAYHLPLDAHRELGNNACLAARLDLTGLDWTFAQVRGKAIGVAGDLTAPSTLAELGARLDAATGGESALYDFCARPLQRIGVLSGSGGDIPVILECTRLGCEALVTGNLSEQTVAVARELQVSVVCAGHYNSEKLGVIALGERLAEQFELDVFHLDVPNPV
jgi:dinuclear metal center YbgI/SA1388 family protein